MAAVDELARARPHERRGAKYSPLEWRAYCQGYSTALGATFAVLELAAARFKLRVQSRRRATVAKRSA